MSDPDADLDLDDVRRFAVDLAVEAGVLLLERAAGRFSTRVKGDAGDLVTTLDLEAEEFILARLKLAFPHHRIVAEESGVHAGDERLTWLVDPLDGSNNVAIGLSMYVIGLALCQAGKPVLGVVHDPVNRHTWSAVRGMGALGPPGLLRPAVRKTPHGPVLGWTQGHGVSRSDPAAVALKLVLERHAHRLLQLWAPLLCWVMLARGDIDGFVGYRAEAVDLPAGSLIAAEAGISIVGLDGSAFDDMAADADRRSFVAAHPHRIGELLDLVRAASTLEIGLPASG